MERLLKKRTLFKEAEKYLGIWIGIELIRGILILVKTWQNSKVLGGEMLGHVMALSVGCFVIYVWLLVKLYKKKEWARRLILILIDIQLIYALIRMGIMISQREITGMICGIEVIYYVGAELLLKSRKMREYFRV